jgi:hypothetical protein
MLFLVIALQGILFPCYFFTYVRQYFLLQKHMLPFEKSYRGSAANLGFEEALEYWIVIICDQFIIRISILELKRSLGIPSHVSFF